MSQPIDPVRAARERRRQERRTAQRRAEQARTNLPVPAGAAADVPKAEREGGAAAFAAQLMGQTGQKRGLKAGPPALEEARSAYLESAWRGTGDRRTRTGRVTKTEI